MPESTAPWSSTPDQLAALLRTDLHAGLTGEEATRRLAAHGRNELAEAEPVRWLALLASQFTNTMILVLAAAAVVTFAIGDRIDTVVIITIVLLNATVGFVQEFRAEQAMAALRGMTATTARVVRDGVVTVVPANELVPGDLVRVETGDVVPADLRLVEVHALRVDEASLTGESEGVSKTTAAGPASAPLPDRLGMAYKATAVSRGRATGVVVATGMATEVGRIAALLDRGQSRTTPLQRRLAALGRRLATAAIAVCAVVFALGVASGEPTDEMFLTAVSLAVAAIPEGLPAVVTVALALGARRMARRRSVIRRLPAVETLGSVSVICTDKTGTLTENRMTVERVWTRSHTYSVTGDGYTPTGAIDPLPVTDDDLTRLGEVAAACNDAQLHPPDGDARNWTLTGDPTEGALAALAGRLGIDAPALDESRPRCGEVAFDADRKRMTTVHRSGGGYWVAVKGALEALEPQLRTKDAELAIEATKVAAELAASGYRVLALADREVAVLPEDLAEVEVELRLLGLVAIADPPRAEVRAAVSTCRNAGITPVMITGDHPGTARAIATRLDLQEADAGVVTGSELAALDDDDLAARVRSVRVYARTTPEQKLRIIDAWRAHGEVVAMTGDGVNDAPALQRADIGVAMGITGTDVSKEAADMVLADDNFATIVAAVEEGRRIYDNIRRFVRYLLTTNSAEVWVMLVAPLIGLPVPLTTTQILWINLISDGPPAIALGLEPAEDDVMRRPPRPAKESILARGLWQHALAVGLLMAAVTITLQATARAADWPWQTMVFSTLSLMQLGHALAVRSERVSLFSQGLLSNWRLTVAVTASAALQVAALYLSPLQSAFDTEPLTAVQLSVVALLSTAGFAAVEIEKWWHRRGER